MLPATASGTNLAHEGSEARMRRRISVPEVTLILSGTDRPRVSDGQLCSLSRLTFSPLHSFKGWVKKTETGRADERRVGTERVYSCRCRGSLYPKQNKYKKHKIKN